jgi:hypothetical protein
MWVCLNNAFLSIVHKDCKPNEVLVRARRPGDIEKVFPNATVTRYTKSDYLFRAVVLRSDVASAMSSIVNKIGYSNFKGSVEDEPLHDAYMGIWEEMAVLQNPPPYSGFRSSIVKVEPSVFHQKRPKV